MREIKFRAWDKETQSILNSNEGSNFDIEVNAQGDLIFMAKDNFRKVIPMQFTGLLDKNGKEIYEGDIVKGIHFEEIDTGIGLDKLSMDTNRFEVKWDDFCYGWNLYGSEEFEIIGNIYENPDLLTPSSTPAN
jgi:uncharacterized phage protein (TIGR01671 family)